MERAQLLSIIDELRSILEEKKITRTEAKIIADAFARGIEKDNEFAKSECMKGQYKKPLYRDFHD